MHLPRDEGRATAGSDPTTDPSLERRNFLKRILAVAAGGITFASFGRKAEAGTAGIEPFLGEIMMFAGNFAPRGWALCNGQLLPIAQNTALFSLLGTTYGGNGQTTFALPDLRGRAPIHVGQGPGLSDRVLGQYGGEETHTLTWNEMPNHSHPAYAHAENGTSDTPTGLLPARNPAGVPQYAAGADVTMSPEAIGNAGGGQPHDNMQPYLVINFCIALQGVFPSQQ